MLKAGQVKITKDITEEVKAAMKRFKNDKVLVGIPEDKSDRKDGDPINNATILAINEFGSPANNIPAWPVMKIGVRKAQDSIAEQFKVAVKSALTKGLSAVDVYYNRAGSIAANSIKKTINAQEQAPPLKESTLRARLIQGFKGKSRLIVTGQVRSAITYIVKRGF